MPVFLVLIRAAPFNLILNLKPVLAAILATLALDLIAPLILIPFDKLLVSTSRVFAIATNIRNTFCIIY